MLLIYIVNQVSYVLLVAENVLVLDLQLIKTVEHHQKYGGTHGPRWSSSSNDRGASARAYRSPPPTTLASRDLLDIIITSIIITTAILSPSDLPSTSS